LIEITSAQNTTFKLLKSLKQKKYRYREEKFILEGYRFVDDALKNNLSSLGVFFHERVWFELSDDKQKSYEELSEVYILSIELFEMISETENSQGILGVFQMVSTKLEDVDSENSPFLVYCDRLQDPGNLGTVIRTADAAGVKDIIVNKGCVDVYNSKVLRSTAGSILNVNLIFVASDLDAITLLKDKGYHMIVTDLASQYRYDEREAYKTKNCLVIGNEGNGVSEEIKTLADVKVKIPIYGLAESLNASVAAGIMIYKIRDLNAN